MTKIKFDSSFILALVFFVGLFVFGNANSALAKCDSSNINYGDLPGSLTNNTSGSVEKIPIKIPTGSTSTISGACNVSASTTGETVNVRRKFNTFSVYIKYEPSYAIYRDIKTGADNKVQCSGNNCGQINNILLESGQKTTVESILVYKKTNYCCDGLCSVLNNPKSVYDSAESSFTKKTSSGVQTCNNTATPTTNPSASPTPTTSSGGGTSPTGDSGSGTGSETNVGDIVGSVTGSGSGTDSDGASGGESAPTSILPDKPASLPDVELESVINKAIQIIFAVGQISFVIMLLVGGVMFITSAGNEQQAEKAKKLLLYAILGIVVLFAAWAIATFVIGQLSGV